MTLTTAAPNNDLQSLECNHQTIFPVEPANSRRSILAGLLLAVFLALYAMLLHGFYEPAHPGVDQNGYMVTARLLSQHGRLYFKPHNPLRFAGAMTVITPRWQNFRQISARRGLSGSHGADDLPTVGNVYG